ncbi:MAG: hypothetical protein J1G01_01510 [Clostridiales bacterium]|nr:hypothetical protein [Clostridiales bacterium]
MRIFFRLLLFWLTIAEKYHNIKKNPEIRDKDVSMGVTGIIMSIVGTILTAAVVFFTYLCLHGMGGDSAAAISGSFFSFIGGLLCAVVAGLIYIYLNIAAIIYSVYQLVLNKRRVGLAAIIVSVALALGTIGGVILLLTHV